jgi:hypothetical protein
MFEIIQEAATFYWHSGLAIWVTLGIGSPMAAWEVVKRMPQQKQRKKNGRSNKKSKANNV